MGRDPAPQYSLNGTVSGIRANVDLFNKILNKHIHELQITYRRNTLISPDSTGSHALIYYFKLNVVLLWFENIKVEQVCSCI